MPLFYLNSNFTVYIMKEKRKMKLWLKLTIIFSSIIFAFGVILGCAIDYFRLPVLNYYKASDKAFVIPEYNSGYVAQGICFDQGSDTFILSGYMKGGSPSPLYALSKNGEYIKKLTLKTPDGKDYVGHGGGVATFGEFIYIAGGGDCCLYVYSLTQFKNAVNGDALQCIGVFPLKTSDSDYISPAFVNVNGNALITGEFFREANYPTPESHKITTTSGNYNQALAIEFTLNESFPLGINPTPVKAYSLPDKAQGLTTNEDKIYLSTSWGISFSHVYEYDQSKLARQNDITILNSTLPFFALDSASLTNDYKLPPMSEEIVFVDNLLYVNCESASDKYIFGKFTGGKYLYKTDLSKMSK